MLVVLGFFILAFTGGVWSGGKPAPACDKDEPLCPKHQHYTRNDPTCRKTCANRLDAGGHCKPFTGCVCDDARVRLYDDATGPCVLEKRCRNRCKGRNEVYKECPNPCPLTCAQPNPRPCTRLCPKSGCECADGFVLDVIGGKCIRLEDCPVPCCPKNEHYVRKDTDCIKTCGNRLLPGANTAGACVPFTGCVCDDDNVRKYDNGTGPCIPKKKCPRIPKECGKNEQPTSCRIKCPPQTCNSIFTTYDCPEPVCEPGCDCINGYLKDDDGVCIPSEDCFKPDPIECGPNEVLSDCKRVCPPQSCESLYTTYLCAQGNCTVGCNCIDGFLRNQEGVCIPSEDCSKEPCNGDLNATHVECGSKCRATCAQPDTNRPCILVCVLNACECKTGYIFSEQDKVCIEPNDCPGGSPKCPANQTYVRCKVGCPTNYCPSDDSRAIVACSMPYPCPGGCACNQGYLYESRENPRCILSEECPQVNCTRPNEVWNRKPPNCFLERCEDIGKECDNNYPAPPRCVCQQGYFRDANDVCVPASECPDVGCNGDLNATYTTCTSACPASCADLSREGGGRSCIALCQPPGCVCKESYIFNDYGKCIKPEDCPEPSCNGDPNAVYSDCPSACQPTCANPKGSEICTANCLPSGCVCKKGYVWTKKGGKCIKPENCTEPSCNGDPNAVHSDCPSACQPTCANPKGSEICTDNCLPSGCVCKKGYVLIKKGGKCVKPENCTEPSCNGDPNAVHSDCPSACQPTCANPKGSEICTANCLPSGCVCKKGYVWTKKGGKCIKPENCTEPSCNGDPNAVHSDCPSACQPTCANPKGSEICTDNCLPSGCVCKKGYVLIKKGGKCVKPENCTESGCNGDPNAVFSKCPSPCGPTCANPDPNQPCMAICLPSGCTCKKGYVFSGKNGTCIKPEHCPGCDGDPNAVHSDCPSACQPTCANPKGSEICTKNCLPSGCVCKVGYIKTDKNGKCIKPEHCPAEPQCNGDRNATLTTCPSPCQATCEKPDTDRPCIEICLKDGCVCKPGYLRRKEKEECINPYDCPGGSPTCEVNQTYVYCKVNCPTDYCPVDDSLAEVACDPTNPCRGGCVCKEDYLRISYEDERCILSSECPPVECTRPNEVWHRNPPRCLKERCDDKDSDTDCGFYNPISPRCVCKKGYLRNDTNICVPASECTKPKCGYNEIAVPCRQICPPQNCEIAYTDYACGDDTKKCEPGCNCLHEHLRNGSGICIPNDKCPYPSTPVCGVNEIARDCRRICPPQTCISKYALFRCKEDIPCEPGCDCVQGYLRDHKGVCIPSEDCPPLCPIPNECKKTCATPNPPNCDYRDPPESNIDGCECKRGSILSKIGGDCIKIEDCPMDLGCNGDPHARTTLCPHPCPSTCEAPDASPCKRMCDPIGCSCEDNYLLNKTGQCILADECPGGNPCGKSGRFVPCKVNCPHEYCPVDDSREIIVCDPPNKCLSGCVCNLNHKKKSYKDPRCIVSSDCPRVNCTRPNEKWHSCPSACLRENCEDVNNQPTTCNTLVLNCEPACICKKDHFRNASGICIPAKDCPC